MSNPTILVSALDWGLGHAARSIPLVHALLKRGMQVQLAGSGNSLKLLQESFPDLPAHEIPPYDVRYTKGSWQIAKIASQLPRLWGVINQEHTWLRQIVAREGIDAIISDNRYGLWHPDIPSIVVCHQLHLLLPGALSFTEPIVYQAHRSFLERFDEIWVPDLPGEGNLAGKLSHPKPLSSKVRYVGFLSRFAHIPAAKTFSDPRLKPENLSYLAVLSGPEPQRSLLEERLIQQSDEHGLKLWIVQGNPAQDKIVFKRNLCLISHLSSSEMALALRSAKAVISRPGYSSLMDYASLGLGQMVLVPTPGQTEQAYLGKRLQQQQTALCSRQTDFSFPNSLASLHKVAGFALYHSQPYLDKALDSLEKRFV